MAAKRKYLTFKTSEIVALVEDAKTATHHRHTYDQLFDPLLHKGGKVKMDEHGWPDANNIDPRKIKAAIWVIKDHGCYLMANAQLKSGQDEAKTAYALEANPNTMAFEIWWENARSIMGGDDSVTALPLEWFEEAIRLGNPTFRLQFLAHSIKLVL